MCGIFGLIKDTFLTDEDEDVMNTLERKLRHRGPDGSKIKRGRTWALGHTRLAINDPENGEQPFKYKNYFLIANGEIYNYRYLKEKYNIGNEELQTNSDCEIILPLVDKLGITRAISTLEGMYAIAIIDQNKNELYLARDGFGEKPLYYGRERGRIIFSSEMSAILYACNIERQELINNNRFMINYLQYGYCPNIGLNKIKSLKRDTIVKITPNYEIEIKATEENNTLTNKNWCEQIESYIDQSIISDVPISIGLSGGLDSTYIASRLRKVCGKAYTVAYESSGGVDEQIEARNTARYLDLEHEVVTIADEEVAELFRRQSISKDVPINDKGIAYLKLYEKASIDGYKVMMMGHGGDEIFIGYDWLQRSMNINREGKNNILYETLEDYRVYKKGVNQLCKYKSSDYWQHLEYLENSNNSYMKTVNNVTNLWLEPNSLRMADALSMSVGLETRQPLLCKKLTQILQHNKHLNKQRY